MKKNVSIITLVLCTCGGILLGYFIRMPKTDKVNKQTTLVQTPEFTHADYITYKEAMELRSNYVKYRKSLFLDAYVDKQCVHLRDSTHPNFEESNSVWFTYNELNGFLNDIITNNSGVNTKDLGVRIYYGVYSDNSVIDDMHPYPNKMTVFLVPTKRQPSTPKGTDTAVTDMVSKTNLTAMAVYNHGKLCPPDTCKGSAF